MFGLWNTYYLMLIYFSLKLDLLAVNWLDASTILVCKESQLFRHMPICSWLGSNNPQCKKRTSSHRWYRSLFMNWRQMGQVLSFMYCSSQKRKVKEKKIKMCRLAVSFKSQRNSNSFLIMIIISLGPYMNPTKFYLVSNNPGKGTRLIAILKFEPFH